MSDLEAMCRELEAVCTLAKGFAVHLDGFATQIERTQRDTWQVAGPLLSDQLTTAMQACGRASAAVANAASQGADYITHVRG